MGIRIGDDDGGALSSIRQSIDDASRANRNLASGNRINQAADAAAGLSIAENLAARVRSFDAAQRNVQAGVSLAQTAEGGLNSIQQGTQRIRELAVQAANGTLGDEDRQAIQTESNEIRTQIDQTANQTEFNGRQLLQGGAGGANAVQITSGIDGETVDIDVADVRAAELGLDNIDVTSQAGAQAAIATVDAASQQVTEARAQRWVPSKTLSSAWVIGFPRPPSMRQLRSHASGEPTLRPSLLEGLLHRFAVSSASRFWLSRTRIGARCRVC